LLLSKIQGLTRAGFVQQSWPGWANIISATGQPVNVNGAVPFDFEHLVRARWRTGVEIDDLGQTITGNHSGWLIDIGGTSLHVSTESIPIAAAAMNTYGRAPSWGSSWKAFVREKRRAMGGQRICNAATFPL